MDPITFGSNRSATLARHACVSSDVPIASKIGVDILQKGGNAADAAVAMAAAVGVLLPATSGIGGDCFCLFYRASDRKVLGLNGSGRSPAGITLDLVKSRGFSPDNPIPPNHGLAVTVPGAVAGMADCISQFGSGKFSLADLLAPSIKLAEDGFPVHEIGAFLWDKNSSILKSTRHGSDLLIHGRTPRQGEVIRLPLLAQSLKEVAEHGKAGFYTGRVAEKIVAEVQHAGGCMTLDDLRHHMETVGSAMEPVFSEYRGKRLWQLPPNTQGIIALIALNILQDFKLKEMGHNSTDYIHIVSEALRLALADGLAHIADPEHVTVPVNRLLSLEHGEKRAMLISPFRTIGDYDITSLPDLGCDTSYLSVIDENRNACSFISSNSSSFGTGLVPEGCGFPLHDRGHNFNLEAGSPNVIGPRKRSIHTIIPAMLTDSRDNSLLASYGVMGRWMQPQGHVQVLLNMLEFGMNPQKALDSPRFYVGKQGYMEYRKTLKTLTVEDGIPHEVMEELRSRGQEVEGPKKGSDRVMFGRGHIVACGKLFAEDWEDDDSRDCLWGAGDPRADSMALGY